MVSPKPKQTTLSNFKAFSQSPKAAPSTKKQSPKNKANQPPANKSPKENTVSSTVTSDISTTPVRGVKRKSDFSEEENKEGTPVKQAKIPPMEKISVEDSPKSRGNSKPAVLKPTLESMLIRSPKQQNSKKGSPKSKDEVAETSEKTDLKSGTELKNMIPVKPVKKKFGDYKRTKNKSTDETEDGKTKVSTPVSSDKPSNSGSVSLDKKDVSSESSSNIDAKTSDDKAAVTTTNSTKATEKGPDASSSDIAKKTEAKENIEPSKDESKISKVHVDSEKPGPSGVNKAAVKKVNVSVF